MSTRLELAAATVGGARVTSAVCVAAVATATLIGCRWRHGLIIAAAKAAILTTATTWRIVPIWLVICFIVLIC